MDDRPATVIHLQWERGLKFISRDQYGHSVTVDAPAREGDSFDGFKPGELLLTSLAACSGIDVVEILRKQRQRVTGLRMNVRGAQQPHPPWAWEQVLLEYIVEGRGLSMSTVARAIHLSETRYCSVGATLKGRVSVTSTYQIIQREE